MAATSRAFTFSHISDLSSKSQQQHQQLTPQPPPPQLSRHFLISRRQSSAIVSCLSSGGGVSDDFVSTRKSTLDREFSVIANMLKRVEPLDTSDISKGVSVYAKDSMKQTISTMLGLLPSDDLSITVRVSAAPLYGILFSSVITGYTLWNAEYRMSLTRSLDVSTEGCKSSSSLEEELKKFNEEGNRKGGSSGNQDEGKTEDQDLEISPQVFGDLSIEASNYIQQLQSELSNAKKELLVQMQEYSRLEFDRGNGNDLLEYLRALDFDMVEALSQPSSAEVEDIIHHLVRNTLNKFFDDIPTPDFMVNRAVCSLKNHQDGLREFYDTIDASRDYLAKLLFWCMLLGHRLRGLENRLHLSCAVGLL